MTSDTPQDVSGEQIRQAASDTVRVGEDIHDRVRDITLLALQNHRFDRHGIRDVVRGVTEGIALGAEEQPSRHEAGAFGSAARHRPGAGQIG